MARNSRKIGLRDVQNLGQHQAIWDGTVIGFGARRQTSTAIIYVLQYRTSEGRQRFVRIGRHGSPWNPDTARTEARRLLGEVAKGGDPAADKVARRQIAMTVTDLCDRYLADIEAGRLLTRRRVAKRESTLISDRGRIDRHIKPQIGHLPVTAVSRADVEAMMHNIAAGTTAARTKTRPRGLSVVRGGRGVASRTVGLLGAIFTYAIRNGIRTDNPAQGVIRYADGRRDRRLTEDEYRRLGNGLQLAQDNGMWLPAVAAARMMVLTGWRRGEVLGLRWSEVDLIRRTARLSDTKTGFSIRPLPQAVCHLIRAQIQTDGLVFPTTSGTGPMVGYRKRWLKIAELAELAADVTPHVLRHSFASLAADLGYGESTIAGLIGHKLHSVTSRYVHAADAVLLAAVDAVATKTAKLMEVDKLDLIAGQAQPKLQSDRSQIGPAGRDEFISL